MKNSSKLFVVVAALLVAGCAALNPFSAANTLEQKSYALYGSFVIFEEQAAKIIQSPEVRASLKRDIQQADAVAKPAADQLKVAADSLIAAKRQLDAGATDKAKVRIAADNLSDWYRDAKPKIECFINIIEEKPCSN